MKNLKSFMVLLIAQLLLAGVVFASEIKTFNQEEFDEAKKSGDVILLDFYATWCPTCKKQQPIIKEVLSQEQFSSVVAFKVDYDSATDLKAEYKIPRQSTLVVLKGDQEKGRSIAPTTKEAITELLNKGF